MRVLITADPFVTVPPTYYGGIERIVAALIVKLRERGHEIGLVAHPASTAPVDYFRGWPSIGPETGIAHLMNMVRLKKATAEFEPMLVHSFSRLAYLLPILSTRIPKVMSYQRFVSRYTVAGAARLAGKSLAFTGCSTFIADSGREFGGVWHSIPNFVDTDFYSFAESVPEDAPLIFLSRVEHIKGAHIAIDVAKRTGRRLILAGNHAEAGEDGAYWNERISPEIGRNRIEYVGPVDDLAKNALLKSAAAMIVPILWDEPFGIVFAEALACGTPVISCPRGALPEIVREGIDGFLIRSVEEACAAVRNIALIDRKQCRRRAETTFSAHVIGRRYEALYKSLIGVGLER